MAEENILTKEIAEQFLEDQYSVRLAGAGSNLTTPWDSTAGGIMNITAMHQKLSRIGGQKHD
jgi:hypothetical protein